MSRTSPQARRQDPAVRRTSHTLDALARLGRPAVQQPTRGAVLARRRGALLRRVLALGDWAAMGIGLTAAYEAAGDPLVSVGWGVLFGPAWILIAKLHGLYDTDHRRIHHSTVDELPALLSASIFGALAVGGISYVVPAPDLSAGQMAVLGAVAAPVAAIIRGGIRSLVRIRGQAQVAALVGHGPQMLRLSRRITTHPEVHLAVAGYFSPKDATGNGSKGAALRWLGPVSDLRAAAELHAIERVIAAEDSFLHQDLGELIHACKSCGLALTIVPSHAGLLGPGIKLSRLADPPLLDFGFSDPPRSTELLKRSMDAAISAVMLALLSPVLIAIALAIKLDSRDPVLFKQVRIGREGKPFTMLKFRTMVADAPARVGEVVDTSSLHEPAFKVPDDPRRTKIGRWLRRSSLDELPQLWNVLVGKMSLVGPRPEEEAVVALYSERQRVRLVVKPGLTGPMQVYGRGELTFEERLALERDYIDGLSIAQDIAILLRTPRAVLRGDGAY